MQLERTEPKTKRLPQFLAVGSCWTLGPIINHGEVWMAICADPCKPSMTTHLAKITGEGAGRTITIELHDEPRVGYSVDPKLVLAG